MTDRSAIWNEVQAGQARPRLGADAETDVVVVGAGITGVTAALLLRGEGKRVILLERNRAADGDTGGTSAHLATQLDELYRDLEQNLSKGQLRTLAQAARRSVNLIEELVQAHGIDCKFARVPGHLYTEKAGERDQLKEEAALLHELEFPTEYLPSAPLPYPTAAAVRVDQQGIIQPRAYVLGLLERAVALGVEVHEHTDVASFKDGDPCLVQTAHGPTVRAREVVFAAHAPLSRVALQTKLGHYNTYVVAFPAREPVVDGLFYDTEDPYNYLRTFDHRGQKYWIVGGQDHRTGLEKDTNRPYQRLLEWVERRFGVKAEQVPYRWSSQVMESVDGLPYIGKLPGAGHLWTATGFGGTGLTWGSLSAEILRDEMLGRGSPFREIFDPSRGVPAGEIPTWLKDNAVVARCYLSDMLRLAEFDDVDAVKPGEGRVVRHDGRLVAAYRDEQGGLRVVTARCPHLGGLVRFNTAEKTWDCPCHGSRFELSGNPLNGPALVGLDPVKLDKPLPARWAGQTPSPAAPCHTMTTSPPRVALLDIDGTLIDSNDAHAMAWADALREHRRAVPYERVRRAIGMGGDQLLPALIDLDSESPEGAELRKRRGQLFRKTYLPSVRAFPGARGLVERLRSDGLLVLAATSAPAEEVQELLRIADVLDLISPGATGGDVESSKPAPDVVQAALARSRALPHEAVMVGDTPYDIESSRRAGVRSIGLRCGGWDDASLAGAIAIYDDPADLLKRYEQSPFRQPR